MPRIAPQNRIPVPHNETSRCFQVTVGNATKIVGAGSAATDLSSAIQPSNVFEIAGKSLAEMVELLDKHKFPPDAALRSRVNMLQIDWAEAGKLYAAAFAPVHGATGGSSSAGEVNRNAKQFLATVEELTKQIRGLRNEALKCGPGVMGRLLGLCGLLVAGIGVAVGILSGGTMALAAAPIFLLGLSFASHRAHADENMASRRDEIVAAVSDLETKSQDLKLYTEAISRFENEKPVSQSETKVLEKGLLSQFECHGGTILDELQLGVVPGSSREIFLNDQKTLLTFDLQEKLSAAIEKEGGSQDVLSFFMASVLANDVIDDQIQEATACVIASRNGSDFAPNIYNATSSRQVRIYSDTVPPYAAISTKTEAATSSLPLTVMLGDRHFTVKEGDSITSTLVVELGGHEIKVLSFCVNTKALKEMDPVLNAMYESAPSSRDEMTGQRVKNPPAKKVFWA